MRTKSTKYCNFVTISELVWILELTLLNHGSIKYTKKNKKIFVYVIIAWFCLTFDLFLALSNGHPAVNVFEEFHELHRGRSLCSRYLTRHWHWWIRQEQRNSWGIYHYIPYIWPSPSTLKLLLAPQLSNIVGLR